MKLQIAVSAIEHKIKLSSAVLDVTETNVAELLAGLAQFKNSVDLTVLDAVDPVYSAELVGHTP